ncbi:hypothetical protein PTTG_05023 [Puccinia triticina 1-1 BBBD Race 1]|uniref:Uncharacterized protein n=1 Tax=Puccinia triticina (isolate 1-1 / race 1 (BBBD)) TaxID=630390 RepID=A0A180GPI9_PUCT1|nr:hypothetical protein PTTG_05023 [Puccinia triticina 1-1 BBBD Race 1]
MSYPISLKKSICPSNPSEEDMLANSPSEPRAPTFASVPGCSTLQTNPEILEGPSKALAAEVENPWMCMKRNAIHSFLQAPPGYFRSLPNFMPSPEFILPIDPKGKAVNIVPNIPVPVFETAPKKALFQAPSSKGRRSAGCLIPYIKSQPGPLYKSPYKGSLEVASSTVYPSSTQSSDAPPAFKRICSESVESASPFDGVSYLEMSLDQVAALLRRGREFPTRFVYNNEQLKEIAPCILLDVFDYFNFYAPSPPQEASAWIYIITCIQKHFNVFLEASHVRAGL